MFRRSTPIATNCEDRKDLFGPVADLMVGVLFIFIILLIGLALNLQPEDYQRLRDLNAKLEAENQRLKEFARYVRTHQVSALFAQIAAANETRAQMLDDMRRKLRVLGVEVIIDPTNGTLKLPAGGLFLAGQAEPTLQGQKTIRTLAQVLVETLPCYSNMSNLALSMKKCPKLNIYSTLSSVYIEGHTDIVPIGISAGRFRDNWDLSAARAIETYKILRDAEPLLRDLRNQDGDALLGVSGYAETRPATTTKDRLLDSVRDLDRRIEVRLTMTANEVAVRQAMEELNQHLERVDDLVR